MRVRNHGSGGVVVAEAERGTSRATIRLWDGRMAEVVKQSSERGGDDGVAGSVGLRRTELREAAR